MRSKIFLDSFFLSTLESLAVTEGIITKRYDGEKLKYKEYYEDKRMLKKSSVLKTITLYDKFEGIGTDLDFSNFKNEGFLEDESNLMGENAPIVTSLKSMISDPSLYNYIFDTSLDYLRRNRNKILTYAQNSERYRFSKIDVEKYGNIKIDRILDGTLNELLDYGIDDTVWYDEITGYIDELLYSFRMGLYYSIASNYYFTASAISFNSSNDIYNNKILENINYIVKTNLTNEILILPNPKTLKEAMAMRQNKELVRFRQILATWIQAVKSGEINQEANIRKDISKANKELKRLKAWREYKESPINFWINSIGGHVPVFSNILTIVQMLGGFYENWADKNYNWILALKKV